VQFVGDFLLCLLKDINQILGHAPILASDKTYGGALTASTSGATHTVHILLDVTRKIIVDDMTEIGVFISGG